MPLPLSSLSALARSLTYNASPGPSLRTSRSNRLVNPRGHRITEDGYSYHLSSGMLAVAVAAERAGRDKPSSAAVDDGDDGKRGRKIVDLNDEAILARFTRGFFGGTVFWPESLALRALAAWGMGSIGEYLSI